MHLFAVKNQVSRSQIGFVERINKRKANAAMLIEKPLFPAKLSKVAAIKRATDQT